MPNPRRLVPIFLMAAAMVGHADPNLLTNGGFETGDFTGWSLSGYVTPCLFVGTAGAAWCIPTSGIGPHSGNYTAELGNDTYDASLAQTVATTVGATYELTFYLASQDYGTPSNDFSVYWGGQQIMSQTNLGPFGYTEYDFSGLVANSSSTTMSFAFHNTPSYFALDDVSLVDPVPESGTLAGLGLGLAALAAGRRLLRARTASLRA